MPQAIAGVVVALGSQTALVGALGIGGLAALGQGIGIAATVGLTAAQFALARTQSRSLGGTAIGGVNAPEVRASVRQAIPVQRVVLGETRAGGAIYFWEVAPPYMYVGWIHSSRPVSEYKTLYIGDTIVPLYADGTAAEAPYLSGGYGGNSRIKVVTQSGAIDQGVNPLIASDFPGLGAQYKLPGLANTVARFHYGANFDEFQALWGYGGIPDLQWRMRGAPVPDPRRPGHRLSFDPRDADDLAAAEATWTNTSNAALNQAYWAMMPFGLNAGPDAIDWDAVARQADFDDEAVGLKVGAFQKRHTVDGVVTLDSGPSDVIEAMLTANRGFLVQKQGKIWVSSPRPADPVLTISDDMLAGPFEFRRIKARRDLVNVGRVRFTSPERSWQEAEAPVLRLESEIASDGEELEQMVRLPFTVTHQRAQRLLKGFIDDARLGRHLSCAVDLRAFGLTEGDVVRRWSEHYPEQNGLYSVEGWELPEDMATLGLVLAEYDPLNAIDWDPATDEQDFPELEAA